MRKYVLFWLLITSYNLIQAQSEFHFSGFVTSETTDNSLSNVRVWIPSDSIESTTNAFGYFNLITTKDSFTAFMEKPGFVPREMQVVFQEGGATLVVPLLIASATA